MSSFDANAFYVYVDGSALKNPGGPGGCAGILEFPAAQTSEERIIFQEGYHATTNNRMELRAVINALNYAAKNGRALKATRIIIVTDSLYVYNHQESAQYWKDAGWRTEEKRPIENADLWNELLSAKRKVQTPTNITWHKGKKSEILKRIDALAKKAAQNPILKDAGFRSGKVGNSQTKSKGASSLFHARGEAIRIKIYRKKPAGKKEQMIFFTVFSAQTNSYSEKFHAYTAPEFSIQLNRSHCYEVLFNDQPKYPIILGIIREIDPENK